MIRESVPGRRVGGLLLALALPAELLGAQVSTATAATLSGLVVNRASAAGVADAEVVLLDERRTVLTDSGGRFRVTGLRPGPGRVRIRAVGFRPAEFTVHLRAGGEERRTITLERIGSDATPQTLAPVAVSAPEPEPSYRLVDFERRRRTGRGHYLTDEEIRQSSASNLQDLTRGMRGVTQHCGDGRGCRLHMVRARPNCAPEYIVDGRPDNMFGSSTPIRDIVALEVYTGPSDVPGEFAGTTAGCGVIVIWTRAGPPRRRP